jgi:hypothetical protein
MYVVWVSSTICGSGAVGARRMMRVRGDSSWDAVAACLPVVWLGGVVVGGPSGLLSPRADPFDGWVDG